MIRDYVSNNANVFVPIHGFLKVKPLHVYTHSSDSWTGYNYIPVEFYFFKYYHQGDNTSLLNDEITPFVRLTQCVSVFSWSNKK